MIQSGVVRLTEDKILCFDELKNLATKWVKERPATLS